MHEIIKKLETLRTSIEEGKKTIATLQGNREANLKRLKDDFELDSLEAAEKWLEKEDAALYEEERQIEKMFSELKQEVERKDANLAKNIFD